MKCLKALTMCLTFTLAACGGSDQGHSSNATAPTTTPEITATAPPQPSLAAATERLLSCDGGTPRCLVGAIAEFLALAEFKQSTAAEFAQYLDDRFEIHCTDSTCSVQNKGITP